MIIETKSQKTVFLVDDDCDDRQFLKEAFLANTKEITFVEFLSGEELLAFIKLSKQQLRPSLIIMDMNMPRMNGLETLQAIRSNELSVLVPIMIMTTSNSETLANQALSYGADGFICKPISFDGYIRICDQLARRFF